MSECADCWGCTTSGWHYCYQGSHTAAVTRHVGHTYERCPNREPVQR